MVPAVSQAGERRRAPSEVLRQAQDDSKDGERSRTKRTRRGRSSVPAKGRASSIHRILVAYLVDKFYASLKVIVDL